MKKIFYLMLSLTAFSSVKAQTPVLTHFGGTSTDEIRDIVTDNSGNVYVVGIFSGSVDFDPSAVTVGITAVSDPEGDAFLAKYNASGEFVWVHQFSGPSSEAAHQVAVDAFGNVIVAGYYFGSMNVDPGATNTMLTSAGDYDAFVSKFDQDGILMWAQTFGAPAGANEFLNTMDVDATGNVYVGGQFQGSGDFDPGAGTITLTSAGGYDIFLSKFNSSGTCLWAKSMGGTNTDALTGLDITASGLYLTGSFRNTVDFDPNAGTQNLTSAGGDDIFVARFNGDGIHLWSRGMGGAGNDLSKSIAVDAGDNIYTVGTYASFNADFDPGAMSQTMTPAGGWGGFISKLDVDGYYSWARQITGSISTVTCTNVQVLANNEIAVTGSFTNTANFADAGNPQNATAIGGSDIFVARYDMGSSYNWHQTHGGANDEGVFGAAVSSANDLFVAGYYGDQTTFNTNPVEVVAAGGFSDAYFMKYGSCSATFGTDVHGHCGEYTWIDGITYTSSNNTATYTLTNQAGCDSVVTLNLTIYPVPDASITSSGANMAAVTSGLQYMWIDCATQMPVPGETNQTFTATMNGEYAVVVSNGACTAFSSCVTVSGLAVSELDNSVLAIAPNPSSNTFKVEMNKDAHALLTSAVGQRLQELTLSKGSNEIILSNYPSGIYYLMINGKAHALIKL